MRLETYNKLKKFNIKGFKTAEEEKSGYPEWTAIKDIRKGTALDWFDLEDMC